MDFTHLHLIITHLPIFGILLGILVLIYGLYTNSPQTLFASYLVFSVACLGGLIAYVTGESAEETVEHLSGISKSLVESHEESAELSVIGFGILWAISFLVLFFNKRLMAFNRKIAVVILILSIICFVSAARTGYLGGQIRHTELSSPNLAPEP
jgi:uncharacterized membrane protein